MKVEFNILWLEDIVDEESITEEVVEPINELGMIPMIDCGNCERDALDLLQNKHYDLILMDFKLQGGSTGDDIIQKIRERDQYTIILFYSASGARELRKYLFDRSVDGVYCSDREEQFFIEKVHGLINLISSKLHHINNIRGLAMAEGSDIEESMSDILRYYFDNNPEPETTRLREYLFSKVEEKLNYSSTTFASLKESNNIIGLINSHLLFDSITKAKGIQELSKQLGLSELRQFVSTFTTKVSSRRNKLGHAKGHIQDGLTVFLDNSGGVQLTCDVEFCGVLRQDIIEHKDLLKMLENKVHPNKII